MLEEEKNDLFYNMDELCDLLGLHPSELNSNSRAQYQQNTFPFMSNSTKDGKLLSAETFTDTSTSMNPTSIPPASQESQR